MFCRCGLHFGPPARARSASSPLSHALLPPLTTPSSSLQPSWLLQDVAGTLEELWISYNQISSLDGLQPCVNLRVLYMANNALKDWSELDKIAGLPHLREVLFIGNPIYEGMDRATAKMQVLKRLPRVAKVDNEMVIDAEREAAAKL